VRDIGLRHRHAGKVLDKVALWRFWFRRCHGDRFLGRHDCRFRLRNAHRRFRWCVVDDLRGGCHRLVAVEWVAEEVKAGLPHRATQRVGGEFGDTGAVAVLGEAGGGVGVDPHGGEHRTAQRGGLARDRPFRSWLFAGAWRQALFHRNYRHAGQDLSRRDEDAHAHRLTRDRPP